MAALHIFICTDEDFGIRFEYLCLSSMEIVDIMRWVLIEILYFVNTIRVALKFGKYLLDLDRFGHFISEMFCLDQIFLLDTYFPRCCPKICQLLHLLSSRSRNPKIIQLKSEITFC